MAKKLLISIIITNLILINVPLGVYAGIDTLRRPAASDTSAERIQRELQENGLDRGIDGGAGVQTDFLTLSDWGDNRLTLIVRGDLNVTPKDGQMSLTDRMGEDAKTVRELSDRGHRVIFLTHQGRKGDADYLENLEEANAVRLFSQQVGKEVKYVNSLFDPKVVEAIQAMRDGDILMLMNTRSWDAETDAKLTPEEQANSELVRTLLPYIDGVVLNAFSVAHRPHVSVAGWSETGIPIIAGRLMEKEIVGNSQVALGLGEKPYIVILGGAKPEDYLGFMYRGLKEGTYDKILAAGVLGELFLVAQGYKLGADTEDSLRERLKGVKSLSGRQGMEGLVEDIKWLLEMYPDRIIVPIDVAFINANGEREEVVIEERHKTEPITESLIGDIGTQTAEMYAKEAGSAKTVFIKGPMGIYEREPLAKGSRVVLNSIASNQDIYLISGGGDTNALFTDLGLIGRINYYSLAGGAFLEFLEGRALPGLVALDRSAKRIRQTARALNVTIPELFNFMFADKTIYRKMGGAYFNKYLEKLASVAHPSRRSALIIASGFLRIGGANETISRVIRTLNRNFGVAAVALYGEDAEKHKALLGDEGIVTGKNLNEALAVLSHVGISPQNTILLRTPEDIVAEGLSIRQIVARDINPVTLVMAKAIKEASGENIKKTLGEHSVIIDDILLDFLFRLRRTKRILSRRLGEEETQNRHLLRKLEEAEVFTFPEDLTVTKEVTDDIKRANETVAEFMGV